MCHFITWQYFLAQFERIEERRGSDRRHFITWQCRSSLPAGHPSLNPWVPLPWTQWISWRTRRTSLEPVCSRRQWTSIQCGPWWSKGVRKVQKHPLKYGSIITSILSTRQWSKHNQGTRSIECLVPPPDASSSPCVGSMSHGHGLQGWQRLPEVPLWTSRICAAGLQVVFHTA